MFIINNIFYLQIYFSIVFDIHNTIVGPLTYYHSKDSNSFNSFPSQVSSKEQNVFF